MRFWNFDVDQILNGVMKTILSALSTPPRPADGVDLESELRSPRTPQ
jgi:hypothetical protein